MKDYAAAAAGVIMLGVFAWSWRGKSARSRWWAEKATIGTSIPTPSIAMGILPGFGLALLSIGVYGIVGKPILPLAAPMIFVGLLVGVGGVVFPPFLVPRWFRAKRQKWRRQDKRVKRRAKERKRKKRREGN